MKGTPIDLNDLPKWSNWPSRALGLIPWTKPNRTIEKVWKEYDGDKYGACLARYEKLKGKISVDQMKEFEEGDFLKSICISRGNDLFAIPLGAAREEQYALFTRTMGPAFRKSKHVLELGCGYGVNLVNLRKRFPQVKTWRGGELSRNAVTLVGKFFADEPSVKIDEFNFFEKRYPLFEKLKEPITIFTMHALEQLPDSSPFFRTILKYRKVIDRVFHFEPVLELYDDSLIGLLRRRYAEINHYNQDLLSRIKEHAKEIEIIRIQPNVMGIYPLNSTSIIEWRFR